MSKSKGGAWTSYRTKHKDRLCNQTGKRCWYCGVLLVDIKDIENDEYKTIYSDFCKEAGIHARTLIKRYLQLGFDHILSRKLGGKHHDNIVISCTTCNAHKQEFHPDFLRTWIFKGCRKKHDGELNNIPLIRRGIKRYWIITKDTVIFYGEALQITKQIFGMRE
ncbi:MAG TPA: HNH endonuclease [Nitrosopumilaceae archaeon]|jgi:hypothetical protein|nr:HNH endonuclease [Nitrosopumilaceae archaeon]